MNHRALFVAALACAAPAQAAERNYSVTSFDRIRVDGGLSVTLKTGVAPFARASGSPQAIDGISVEVQGRTLIVRPNRSAWGGYPGSKAGPVTLSVGTHELAAAWVNGAGSLAIDRVKGLSFQSELQGSGSLAIAKLEADQVRLGISGAGNATLSGKTAKMTAVIRGASDVDASGLAVKDLVLGAEGPATVKANATSSAKLSGSGTATIALTGRPACTLAMTGSASVTGCK